MQTKRHQLNVETFKLRRKEAAYIGDLLKADGLKIDPERVQVIKEMPKPTDVKPVQKLLVMVNNLAKFCPHLS